MGQSSPMRTQGTVPVPKVNVERDMVTCYKSRNMNSFLLISSPVILIVTSAMVTKGIFPRRNGTVTTNHCSQSRTTPTRAMVTAMRTVKTRRAVLRPMKRRRNEQVKLEKY